MSARFFRFWAVLALLLCVSAPWVPSSFAVTPRTQGIDPALLAKATAGDAKSQYKLGNMYYLGDGVRRDYSQAEFWWRKAAVQRDPAAQFMLGGLYHFGQGVPQDAAQAFAWVKKAADQGHTDAEFFIATCYTQGWGVPKDDGQGMVWLRKAAEQGHFNSQFMLGWAYEAGDFGVPQDYAEAYFWLDVAASGEITRKNRKEALKRRDEVASHLTPSDLSRVQERARKWWEYRPSGDNPQ
jgi:TPR repeat protein